MSQHPDLHSCADVLERLEAWIDGDLDESEAAAVNAHIRFCGSCRAERRLAETVVAELRALPEIDVPENVLRAVRSRTRPILGERFRAFFKASRIPPMPALAVVVAAVLIVLVLSPSHRHTEQQYTDQEVARAVAETKLALAYVGSIAHRAELRVERRVLSEGATAQTVRGFRRSLRVLGEAGAAAAELPVTPTTQMKGS
jgi:predicted anti-sigma-YlaC factor YlaD